MKLLPRIRKTIRWGGAALTVLLVVTWIASGWWNLSYWATTWGVTTWPGVLRVGTWSAGMAGPKRGFDASRTRPEDVWHWDHAVQSSPTFRCDMIPFWWLTTFSAGLTAAAWGVDMSARRRELAGRCPRCGYDRTGLAAQVPCPECGSKPTTPE